MRAFTSVAWCVGGWVGGARGEGRRRQRAFASKKKPSAVCTAVLACPTRDVVSAELCRMHMYLPGAARAR
jgi:hypothetical protein